MPRNLGTGVYTLPTGTTAVPDTPIESAKYNAFTGDVAQDLNAARPISSGGTGATNATVARTNLGLKSAAVVDIGTSGAKVPLLDGNNTWDGTNLSTVGWNVKAAGNIGYQFQDADGIVKAIIFATSDRDLLFQTRNTSGVTSASMALDSVTGTLTLTGFLDIASGGTGAKTVTDARSNLGLGSAALRNIGTSGSNVPLFDGDNTWSGTNLSTVGWNVRSSGDIGMQFLDGSGVLKGSIFSASTRDLWFRTRDTSGVPTGSMVLSGGDLTLTGSLDVASGGTGAKTASAARANLGAAASATTITAGLCLSGGGSLATNRTINLDFSGLPLSDPSTFADPRFLVIDGALTNTLARSTAFGVRTALGLGSLATMEPSDILYSAGGVGSYALMYGGGGAPGLPGQVVAGSSLNYADTSRSTGSGSSGSWRRMGYTEFGDRVTLYQRIS